jgi:hypothetical protein
MERSPICPKCLSKYLDIRGCIFHAGKTASEICEDVWHRGAEYNPDVLVLTAKDREFLASLKISLEPQRKALRG